LPLATATQTEIVEVTSLKVENMIGKDTELVEETIARAK